MPSHALHEQGHGVATIVGNGAVAVDELQQVDLAAAQCQGACLVEFGLYAHRVGSLGDVMDTTFHSDTHGDGVDAHGKGIHEGELPVAVCAVGIVRSPDFLLSAADVICIRNV